MSERQPWWYSGDDAADTNDDQPSRPRSEDASAPSVPGLDWMALLSGAQKVVDWATDRVLAPHSEHGDPHDHPDCMVCRTLVMAGRFDVPMPWSSSSPSPTAADVGAESGDAEQTSAADASDDAIRWIPIIGDEASPQP